MKEKKAHNHKQLKQEADNDKKNQGVKPTIEQFTKIGASDQSCLHKGHMRIGRRNKQNQNKNCETETTNLQIQKLVANIEKDFAQLKAQNESFLKKQNEIENTLSAHLEEYLSSTLENQQLKNGTNNIGPIRTIDNELKPKTKKSGICTR